MVKIKNLTKKYGNTVIFENTDFMFPQSGLVCLLGASGSGKSTLLNLIAGFDSNYSGEISSCGQIINKMNADELCEYRRDNIGFVFQNYCLITGYSVLENILLPCELHQTEQQADESKAKELLASVGLTDKINEKVENLSGGQKQRVAIARALINSPKLVLADEPTGALDRTTSSEIMALLKEISKNRLVIVITHDKKICDFADQVIHIEKRKIVADNEIDLKEAEVNFHESIPTIPNIFKRSLKNFRIHIKRYIAVALAVSIGVVSFLLSLSYNNVIDKSILDFQAKNTALQNGYIKLDDNADDPFKTLTDDSRLENVYYQYVISDVILSVADKTETMAEKYPMAKATEKMSYGVMPKIGENQIALSPSLAKKFDGQISNLIGKSLTLKYEEYEYTLTISGIFNAGYDDFFVSSDIEQKFYEGIEKSKPYSVSYDVKDFENIVPVTMFLKENNLSPQTAADEVDTMQNTFSNIRTLFFIISTLILLIGIFICTVLLVKLQNTRYKEVGLLSALGYKKGMIRKIIVNENLILSVTSAGITALFTSIASFLDKTLALNFAVSPLQFIITVIASGMIVVIISVVSSHKLISTEPAQALRK